MSQTNQIKEAKKQAIKALKLLREEAGKQSKIQRRDHLDDLISDVEHCADALEQGGHHENFNPVG